MSNVPARAQSANRPPLQPVQLLRVDCQAGIADLLAGHAVISISTGAESDSNTTVSRLQAFTDHAGKITCFRLTKFGTGEVYDLDAALESCTCADATYREERPGVCRHRRGLREALLSITEGQDQEPEWPDERYTIVDAVAGEDDEVVDVEQRWTITGPDDARASA
jgi:hypothetical protein